MGSLAAICCIFVVALLLVAVSRNTSGSIDTSLRLQHDDSVSNKRKPFCPGPVLKPSEREEPWNRKFSEKLNKEVASKDADKGCELVFYGDSITETWRATDNGRECPQSRCEGVSDVFKQYFGNLSTSVLAVGGDQAMHLLYRLQRGQIYKQHQPKLAIVLIGTNDLGAASCQGGESAILQSATGAAERVIQNLQYMHEESPGTHILAVGLLPRGFWQDPKDMFKLPSAFSRAISAVNHALERYAFGTERMHYADCAKPFVQTGNLSPELMPDALHPNAAGMALLADCTLPFVKLYGRVGS